MPEIKMPQLGESVVEGTITKWLKNEGDNIDEDELLVEVSTDKVDSEVPSSASGTIQKILVQEGETVKVGTPIAVIGDGAAESDGAAQEAEAEEPSDEPAEAEKTKTDEGAEADGSEESDGAAASADTAEPEADASAEEQGDPAQQAEADQKASGNGQGPQKGKAEAAEQPSDDGEAEAAPKKREGDQSKRGVISPLVRRLADEHGVDLEQVDGTGTGGRIRKQDVLKAVETKKAAPKEEKKEKAAPAAEAEPADKAAPERRAEPSVARTADREELVPWTNIRRRTAEHMVASERETARAWNAVEADWTNIVKLREKAKASFKEREGFNLTYMPFLAKVISDTLLEMPEVNATFDEENQGNRIKHYVNLGIAVALEGGGLIVPVVKQADELNLVGLARSITDVATRARSKKLSPDDLSGGTFTITNPGPFGSIISVPIIPRNQTAILGFEAIQKRVVVTDDDSFGIRSMGFLSLSWDHRIIDGAEAARFLARLREGIETTDFSSDLGQYL